MYISGPLNDGSGQKVGVVLPLSHGPILDGVTFVNYDTKRSFCFAWTTITVNIVVVVAALNIFVET